MIALPARLSPLTPPRLKLQGIKPSHTSSAASLDFHSTREKGRPLLAFAFPNRFEARAHQSESRRGLRGRSNAEKGGRAWPLRSLLPEGPHGPLRATRRNKASHALWQGTLPWPWTRFEGRVGSDRFHFSEGSILAGWITHWPTVLYRG